MYGEHNEARTPAGNLLNLGCSCHKNYLGKRHPIIPMGAAAAAGAPLRNRHINAGWLLLLIVWQGCYSLLSHIIGAAAKKYNGDCCCP